VQNSNFLLETAKGRFILTVLERTQKEHLPFFMGMMGHLASKGFPALPVPAKDGNPLRIVHGKPGAVICTFLQGMSPRRPTSTNAALGQGLAEVPRVAGQIPGCGGRMTCRSAHGRRRGKAAPQRPTRCRPDCRRRSTATSNSRRRTGRRRCPAARSMLRNLFPDNTFLLDGKLSGVIDFYSARSDFLAYDLAVRLNAWAFEQARRVQPHQGPRADRELHETVRRLEPRERARAARAVPGRGDAVLPDAFWSIWRRRRRMRAGEAAQSPRLRRTAGLPSAGKVAGGLRGIATMARSAYFRWKRAYERQQGWSLDHRSARWRGGSLYVCASHSIRKRIHAR